MTAKPHPKEGLYFAINVLISLGVIYLVCRFGAKVLGDYGVGAASSMGVLAVYVIFILLFAVVRHGMMIGNILGNGVKINASQFAEIHDIVVRQSALLGLKKEPAVYLLQAGGALNAFATRSAGRNYVVLYSDVLEKAYDQGTDVVEFIVAHELTHVRRHHVTKMLLTCLGAVVLPLRFAYSRACEYTCDAFAAELAEGGAERGMLLLCSGKRLFERVNADEYLRTHDESRSFWKWFAEVMSTHPHLPNRIRRMREVRGASETGR